MAIGLNDSTGRNYTAGPDDTAHRPPRVLVISGDMGEGHNATARAVEESLRRRWPGCSITRLDTLAVMGRGVGPLFRKVYVTNIETTPWLYEFFYSALWRMRWFAEASKRFIGAWSGRRLARHLAEFEPDVIVSTYPLGSAGLQWLRRRRGLRTPVSVWISDFAPHPFWVFGDLDVHYVMHQVSVAPARAADPRARVEVCAPPVVAAFAPGDRAAARAQFDLRPDAFVALLSCGSLGFGTIERAVEALLRTHHDVAIVVACGRNDALRRRVLARGLPSTRLVALGWTDDMAALTVAADVVVTNAGGATALEAVACARTVVMFEPIAAHGRANAALMHASGLATLCDTGDELVALIDSLRADPGRLAEREARAQRHIGDYRFDDAVHGFVTSALAPVRAVSGSGARELRAQDAFFLHTDTAVVAQQIGGAALVEGGSRSDLDLLAARMVAQPELCRRLRRASGSGRGVWLSITPRRAADLIGGEVREIDGSARATEARCPEESSGPVQSDFVAAVQEFFSEPLDPCRAAAEVALVRGLAGGRSAILVKAHHALGDGFSVIGSMLALLDPSGAPVPERAHPQPQSTSGAAARDIARGLWHFARQGSAGRTSLNGPMTDSTRRWMGVDLDGTQVRAVSRELSVGTADVLIGVVAEAIHRLLTDRGESTQDRSIRAMVPRTARSAATRAASGNWTVALRGDLPIGPMPVGDRVRLVAAELAALAVSGQREAAGAVMAAIGATPTRAHRLLSRAVYRARWFNVIVSVFPGRRRRITFAGRPIAGIYPVLPLAHEVGLSVGAMPIGDNIEVGITVDAGLVPDVRALAGHVHQAFADLARDGTARTELAGAPGRTLSV